MLATCLSACSSEDLLGNGPTVESSPPAGTSEPIATSALPAPASAPFDLSSVMQRVRHAFRRKGTGHEGGDSTYGVEVHGGRVTLTPFHYPSGAPLGRGQSPPPLAARDPRGTFPETPERWEGTALTLETLRVGRGEPSLPSAGSDSVLGDDGRLAIARGSATETLENTEQGLEQTWRFEERPASTGDLVVAVRARNQTYRGETASGLHFVGSKRGLGFRYGHAKWLDAARRETSVPARFRAGIIELRVPAAVVDSAEYPAVLDPIVGPELGMDQPVFGAGGAYEQNPAVASNGAGTSFVVWDVNGDIYGTRVNVGGTAVDTTGIPISTALQDQVAPAVSYDGTNFLVVWQDHRNGTDYDLYGARVSGAGSVLDPSGIPISTGAFDQATPAVSYDGTNWLVVWSRSGANLDILGARVSPSGAVLDASGFAISAVPFDQSFPAVSHDGTNWLVVWQDTRSGTNADIYGARVSAAGSVLDTSGIPISTATSSQLSPSLSFDGTRWLATWADSRSGSGVFGARVDASGTVLDTSGIQLAGSLYNVSPPAVSHDGTNWLVVWADIRSGGASDTFGTRVNASGTALGAVRLSTTPNRQILPSAAYNGTNWLVVWQDLRIASGSLFGTRLSPSGTVLDTTGIQLSTSVTSFTPVVCPLGSSWLVAWQDHRNGSDYDIYGTRVAAAGTVLDPSGIPISTASGQQGEPSVASDGTNWLVVWPDERDGFFSADIYGARVSASGTVLDGTGIPISTAPLQQRAPAVSHNGTGWLVVWQDTAADFDIYGARVSAGGTVLDSSGIPLSTAAGNQVSPAVASDGTNWLAVWHDQRSGNDYDIYGTRVAADGMVLDSSGIPISTATSSEVLASVAHDGTNFFVAWQDPRNASIDIYGTRVTAGGSILDTSGLAISTALGNESDVALAAGPPGKVLVVYDVVDGPNARVKARILSPDCVPIGATDTTCNGVDDDCAGGTDEDYVPVATACGTGACARTGITSCVNGGVQNSCAPGAPLSATDATCNGIDEDCAGGTDEDYVPVATTCGTGGCATTGVTSCVTGSVHDSCAPDPADSDADGVPNCADACPSVPAATSNGCPAGSGGAGGGGAGGAGGMGAGNGGASTDDGGAAGADGGNGGEDATGGTGGSSVGGESGDAGTSVGGSSGTSAGTGGTAGRGGSSGSSGASGTGGSGQAGDDSGHPDPGDDVGCSCRIPSSRSSDHSTWMLALLVGGAALRRRDGSRRLPEGAMTREPEAVRSASAPPSGPNQRRSADWCES